MAKHDQKDLEDEEEASGHDDCQPKKKRKPKKTKQDEAKPRAKAKATAKAKAKATAKGKAKAKAKAKSKAKKDSAEDGSGNETQDAEPSIKKRPAAKAMLASEVQDDEVQGDEMQGDEITQKAKRGRKRISLAEKATFARRWQPAVEPGKTFWEVLRTVFESDVAPYLVRSSTLEARYIGCRKPFSRHSKPEAVNHEPQTQNRNLEL